MRAATRVSRRHSSGEQGSSERGVRRQEKPANPKHEFAMEKKQRKISERQIKGIKEGKEFAKLDLTVWAFFRVPLAGINREGQ